MKNVTNIKKDKWVRPWDLEKFDNIYDRDERFFAILVKGVLGYLTNHISMYGKPIKHFIFNTGSSYLYVENNGYNYSLTETTGEDWIYMETPRCIVNMGNVSFPTEELTSPFVRGIYERFNENGEIQGFNAEMRRLPIEMDFSLSYVFSTFNEAIVVIQELIDKICFQRYFNIIYLGQTIICSIEFPNSLSIDINQIDMTSTETNQKTVKFDIKVNSLYPIINEKTEIANNNIIIEPKLDIYIKNDKI